MHGKYKVSVMVWPLFSNEGKEDAQKQCGPARQTFEVIANDFDDAVKQAALVVSGIKMNPAVWQSSIAAIEHIL